MKKLGIRLTSKQKKIMKKLAMILTTVLGMSGFASTASAIFLDIDINDRPFAIHGGRYWAEGGYWCWIPGHWSRHHNVWIRGHYRRC